MLFGTASLRFALPQLLRPLDGMVDIRDLKSRGPKGPCWFESSSGNHALLIADAPVAILGLARGDQINACSASTDLGVSPGGLRPTAATEAAEHGSRSRSRSPSDEPYADACGNARPKNDGGSGPRRMPATLRWTQV